jgi:hypothetical protein
MKLLARRFLASEPPGTVHTAKWGEGEAGNIGTLTYVSQDKLAAFWLRGADFS